MPKTVPDFQLQPILIGSTLKLRPLNEDDFEALHQAASDPLIWELHPEARDQRDVFEGFFKKAIESQGAFVIQDAKSEKIIGTSRYYDLEKNSVAIGFTFLARAYWGGAYNRELKTLMIDHAFKSVEEVRFHVAEKNFRSQKALEKIGAQPSGKRDPTTLIYILKRP